MGFTNQISEILNSIQTLAVSSERLFKKFAQLSPEETNKYKTLLDSKVLFKIDEIKNSAGKLTKDTLAQLADITESMDNNEKQIQVLDLDLRTIYNDEFKKLVDAGENDEAKIREQVAAALGRSKDFQKKRKEKTVLAENSISLRTKFNRAQAAIIVSNGIYQKINKRVVDVQTSAPTAGGSKYVENELAKYKPIVAELDNIVTALMAQNVAGKAAPDAIELVKVFGPEAFSTQFLLRPRTPSKQSAAIPADLDKITLEEFKGSPIYYVKKKRETADIMAQDRSYWQVDANGEKQLNQSGEQVLDQKMAKYDSEIQEVFDQLNAMPETWQKYSTISKYLDPPAPATYALAYTLKKGFEAFGKPWKDISDMQKFKLPAAKLSDPAEVKKLIDDNLLDTSNRRGASAQRFAIEAQDTRNHYAVLLALTDMAAESGYPRRTMGQVFLDSIPDEALKKDPQILKKAKEIDSVEANQFHLLRDILIDESANEELPAWLLMKIIDTFSVMGVATNDAEKEKFRSINKSVMAMATKALEAKGWKVSADNEGRPNRSISKSPRSKERSGEVGILFEKIPQVVSSWNTKTVVAQTQGAGPLAQLMSQSDALDKKIAGMQAQMAQVQQQKEQIEVQIRGEKERVAQIQKSQQDKAAQDAAAAQATSQQAGGTPPPAQSGMPPAAAKYKVVYKNANQL